MDCESFCDNDDNFSFSVTNSDFESEESKDVDSNNENEDYEDDVYSLNDDECNSFDVNNSGNETHAYLTKYEKARILGVRAEQIALGAKIFVQTTSTDPFEIAHQELVERKMPLMIKRIYQKKEIVINVNGLFFLDA